MKKMIDVDNSGEVKDAENGGKEKENNGNE
jgi:hypothetical protein